MENKMLGLVASPVVFDGEHHTYHLNGNQLSGVTPIIAWLFPDTYKGIPQSVLDEAAKHGTTVHNLCELCDSLGVADEPLIIEYKQMIADAGLQVACSEYLVSDERYVASAIDKVLDDCSLADIKTTSKLHVANVQLQLSIYAYLFELMNKGKQVPHLYAIWLPKPQYGKPAIKEVDRIPAEFCERLVAAYVMGADPKPYVEELDMMGFKYEERKTGDVPEGVQPLVDELVIIKKQLDMLTEREKELKSALLTCMESNGEQKWVGDNIQISYKGSYSRESVDTKALKENEPALYEQYKKVSKVSASITYKVL